MGGFSVPWVEYDSQSQGKGLFVANESSITSVVFDLPWVCGLVCPLFCEKTSVVDTDQITLTTKALFSRSEHHNGVSLIFSSANTTTLPSQKAGHLLSRVESRPPLVQR